MEKMLVFLVLAFVSFILGEFTQEREAVLDENGLFRVHWSIDYDEKLVLFNLTCESKGFIGFGISPAGGMPGADIVIGGFNNDGTSYIWDMHATAFSTPILDVNQDWDFIEGYENATHTHLAFKRKWDTCDGSNDVSFSNDTTHFIWAFGASDTVQYHGAENRGTYAVNILDPESPPLDTSKLMKFEIMNNMTMLSQDTTYWCKMGKSPRLSGKHHIVAFDTVLPTPEAKAHTHHFTVYKCEAPAGQDPEEYFDPWISHPGSECWDPSNPLPVANCRPILFVWAVGGRMFTLPENVGYPIGTEGEFQYYMIEIHYDNPQELEGVSFETGAAIYYTDQLRDMDAGLLITGYQSNYGITIPPKSEDFQVNGHCSSECTEKFFPPTGINVFGAMLHSHLSGRAHRLRHFRGTIELPWIANDDNYDFNYQQNRLFRQPLTLLPGDHLTSQCYYNTTWREGTTVGGLSSRDEMCEHFIWYYPAIPLGFCFSINHPIEKMLARYGIEQLGGEFFAPIIIKPDSMANMTYQDVMDTLIDWNEELRGEVQNDHFLEQVNACTPIVDGIEEEYFITQYPNVEVEYEPPNQC